ncbi:F-box domain-containing protein [Hypoxylon sp. NC1633]|nr:F-box domain-containing protein [Hypoxylon sp. NC1633]
MSPTIFCCVICGYVIYDYQDPDSASWMNQFRILHSSQETIAVTGVGIYDDPDGGDWMAPLDFAARWDDELSNSDEIGVLRQHPVDDRYGFPLHEACWSLLEKAYSPDPIPREKLFRVCSSLPFPSRGRGLSWGDSHGGLVFIDGDRYPWEDRYVDRDLDSVLPTVRYDPYHVSEILRLRYEEPQVPAVSVPAVSGPARQIADCFSKLPLEIVILISAYLPTVDALNVRRVSVSFLPIFYSHQFWASRFGANADRSWLFESREWDKTYDLRWLYHRTNKEYRTRGMNNRERVWKLIQRTKKTLSLQRDESRASATAGVTNLKWREATGDLRPETRTGPLHGFDEGCRLFHEQQASISPGQLSHMAFSVIQLGETIHIAGIRLILSQDQTIQLGYRAESELIFPATLLVGFNLAVGSRGIQGLQCVFDDQSQSQWVGCPDEAPRTRRLTLSSPITAIKVGFDGYKVVSLGVAGRIPLHGCRSLRDSAFWYPQVPQTGLYLNDDYFTARDTATTGYQPLCWAMFGGLGGIYLRSIVGISVTCFGTVRGIEFHYDSEELPVECRKLGRCRTEGISVIHFPIDGPGGEVIDSVTIYLRYYAGDKVNTDITEKPMTVAPGSTINGFYWSEHGNRFIALGVISEKIERH